MAILNVTKKLNYLGYVTRTSARGNDYGIANFNDEKGETHRLLVRQSDLPIVAELEQYKPCEVVASIHYGVKFPKVELNSVKTVA